MTPYSVMPCHVRLLVAGDARSGLLLRECAGAERSHAALTINAASANPNAIADCRGGVP